MKPESTWWKRLFTVMEIAIAGLTISISLFLCFSDAFNVTPARDDFDEVILPGASPTPRFDPDAFAKGDIEHSLVYPTQKRIPYGKLLLFILIPSVSVRLARIAVTYIIEGKK